MQSSRRSQMMALAAAISCLALPGCGGVNSLSDFYERIIAGPSKQIVKALDNALQLDIDAGTFTDIVTLLFASVLDIPVAALLLVTGIDFQIQEDVDPLKAIVFELLYDPANIPAGFTEQDLSLFRMQNGSAVKVEGATFDYEANKVRADITKEGQYFVAIDERTPATP